VEKKELHNMKRHRGGFFTLGLAVMIGMASEARAATLVLSIEVGGTTIYSVPGNATKVTANVGNVQTALDGAGLSAYSFTNLGATSNNPGTSGEVGGYILTSGTLDVGTGLGAGTVLTIVVTEGGFTAPASGLHPSLFATATANYAGTTTASTQTDVGSFSDSTTPTPVTASTPTITQTSNATQMDGHQQTVSTSVPSYVTPYTLTNTLTVGLVQSSSGGGSDGLTGKTSLISAIPEPGSLVLMLTSLPLPLVMLGLRRRRRRAAV
jgi:hypothetical protein